MRSSHLWLPRGYLYMYIILLRWKHLNRQFCIVDKIDSVTNPIHFEHRYTHVFYFLIFFFKLTLACLAYVSVLYAKT